jgi:hypothetical protein
MRGAPENVAKACVLQALRTAHASGRACRLLAFGGAGELLEQELALTPQGLDNLLAVARACSAAPGRPASSPARFSAPDPGGGVQRRRLSWWRVTHRYSVRSAVIGSTRSARRAGR